MCLACAGHLLVVNYEVCVHRPSVSYMFSRPLWMASVIPPDMILTLLEGITAIIHYCLLDPTTQYHQVRFQRHL